MKYILFTYYDRVSGVYSAPLPGVNRASAIRDMISRVRDSVSANDMELYECGTFDIMTGEVTGCKPVFVCRYEEYAKQEV